MKTAVMGSGGLGGFLGGAIARAGADVTFIARGRRLAALRQVGLEIRGPAGSFRLHPVRAHADAAAVGPVDLVLFCVKSYDVASAAKAMLPLVGPTTTVLPLQNGIEHIPELQRMLGTRAVIGGMTLLGAHSTVPGVVEHFGTRNLLELGEIAGGVSQRCRRVEALLRRAGIEARSVQDIESRLWWKLALICGAGVFAVARGDKSTLWATLAFRQTVERAVAEAVAVGRAHKMDLAPDVAEEVMTLIDGFAPDYRPSLLVDLERGRRLELEAWNGTVVRLGRDAGLATPVNDFVYACLKPYLDGGLHQFASTDGIHVQ